MDRTLWRSRWRWFRRICKAKRRRARQSRLERQPRLHLSRRRDAGERSNRSGRGSSLRLCGVASGSRHRATAWRSETQANEFAAKANAMRRRFDEHFFDEALGTYVLALDGDKRRCRVRSSNAGHALFAGIAYPERASSVARVLMNSSGFCGWGVRTIASTEARYNPMSYHNGSVWPHDNALIAAGIARYGFRQEAARIFDGLFDASTYVEFRRLPELFCGFPRQQTRGPTFYPVACVPQAWSAAARSILSSPASA